MTDRGPDGLRAERAGVDPWGDFTIASRKPRALKHFLCSHYELRASGWSRPLRGLLGPCEVRARGAVPANAASSCTACVCVCRHRQRACAFHKINCGSHAYGLGQQERHGRQTRRGPDRRDRVSSPTDWCRVPYVAVVKRVRSHSTDRRNRRHGPHFRLPAGSRKRGTTNARYLCAGPAHLSRYRGRKAPDSRGQT